jgi:hypothetical protein
MPEKPPVSVGHVIAEGVTLTLAAGVVFLLVSAVATPSQGARASTRLQWVKRQAELDRLADQAEAEGKLRR